MKLKIVITGANRGLGFSLTKQFLEEDSELFTLNRTINTNLENLKQKFPNKLYNYKVDVTNEIMILEALTNIKTITSKIDILINNAAVHLEQPPPDINDLNFTNIIKTIEINSVAPLIVIKHFIGLIKRGDLKLIVNISSEAGSIGKCWRISEYGYSMSKSALNMASKILQNRLINEGIKVLAIHPQWFRSDMGGKDAPITPDQAANHVKFTIMKGWTLKDPIYIDSITSAEMDW